MSEHTLKAAAESGATDGRRMPAHVRKERLIAMVKKVGFVTVPDIATELGVSEMTIRRDLVELETEGLISRTRGGAIPSSPDEPAVDREEPRYDARMRRNKDAKMRIAKAAHQVMGGAQTVLLDVGTTTCYLASLFRSAPPVRTFTNSMRIATMLAEERQEVYVPAGPVRSDELSICGPAAVAHFSSLHFDIGFIGVSGVCQAGLFDYSMEEAEMKRVFLQQSGQKIVLCDASKFERMSLVQIAEMNEIDMLITDAHPPASIADAIAKAGVTLLVADEPDQ